MMFDLPENIEIHESMVQKLQVMFKIFNIAETFLGFILEGGKELERGKAKVEHLTKIL